MQVYSLPCIREISTHMIHAIRERRDKEPSRSQGGKGARTRGGGLSVAVVTRVRLRRGARDAETRRLGRPLPDMRADALRLASARD